MLPRGAHYTAEDIGNANTEQLDAMADRFGTRRRSGQSAADIPIVNRDRPVSGMGSTSPRFELRTKCCDIFLSADNSLTTLRVNASKRGDTDPANLVIVDLGPTR